MRQWWVALHGGDAVLFTGIMELSFPRTFAPKSESTIDGTFAPWYFRSRELSFPAPIRETYNRRSQHNRM